MKRSPKPTWRGRLARARELERQGRFAAAIDAAREAARVARRASDAGPDDRAACVDLTVRLLLELGRVRPAESLLSGERRRVLLLGLGDSLREQGKYAESAATLERGLRIFQRVHGRNAEILRVWWNQLGVVHGGLGEHGKAAKCYQESLRLARKHLEPSDPEFTRLLANLAQAYADAGRPDRARKMFEECLANHERAFGPEDPGLVPVLHGLACQATEEGDPEEAADLYRRALALLRRGPNDPDYPRIVRNLGATYTAMGRFDEADRLYDDAQRRAEKALGPNHPDTAQTIALRGMNRIARGDFPGAEPLLRRAARALERRLGPDHPDLAVALGGMALVHAFFGRREDAAEAGRRAQQLGALLLEPRVQLPE